YKEEGLDVTRAEEFLEMAKTAVEAHEYETAVEHTLSVHTSLDRAKKGLAADADDAAIAIEGIIEEEDKEYIEDIVRRGL
ncbi:MAG: hypothetical protein GWN18_01640, partial [Thermoplasmata archaeon]|nr:hypothetical protein [Thermoplasmata archaeon]NIS10711.1 hypothetical protein [Thermoplasmata archaeon]NIS18652.1 hypothetical protein [Thermoplasmata archaeon]NIT75664.1 hypothetical protein [Thermoplasmata archaeon]NIU47810.1 hypothetical protein [Thermoplasmata archaeon]